MKQVKVCESKTGLASIKEPDTELVIWQRSLDSNLQSWINQTDSASLPDVRVLIKPGEFHPAIERLLDRCGLKAGDMRGRFVADVHNLVIAFADITGGDYVDVRLERISHDACWKFHRDIVEMRLVTTYRGPTTEWVNQAHAEQAIKQQREYNGPLERLGDGNVAIFKGSNYASPDRGIVHRSPPIADTNLTRLLLCLNQWTNTSPDPWTEA